MKTKLKFWSFTLASLFSTASFANVVGSHYQLFNPTYSGSSFVTVESSAPLKGGEFSIGLFYDYAVNTMPYVTNEPVDSSRTESHRDTLQTLHISLGVGITDSWDVGVTVPYIVSQKVVQGIVEQDDLDGGTLEIRVGTKLRLIGDEDGGVALMGRFNFNRIDDNRFLGDNADIGYGLELLWSSKFSDAFDMALNAGYRWIGTGEKISGAQYQIVDDGMITMSWAAGLQANKHIKFILELYRGQTMNVDANQPTDRKQHPFEGLLAVRWSPSKTLAFNVGYAREVQHSLGSPDWRAFAGVNMTLGSAPEPMPMVAPKPMPLPTPEPTPVAQPEIQEEVIVIKNIKFASGSSSLSGDAATLEAINNIVTALKRGFTSLEIGGHSDSIGADDFNLRLSQARADAIKKKIVELGDIDPSKVKAVGYGETQPVDSNATPEGRANNRRVEFSITKG